MKKIVIFVVTFSMMATLGGFTIWKIRENRDRSGELYEFKTEMPELTKEDVSEPSYPIGGKTAYKLLISLKGKQVVELSYITDWETEAQYLLEITEDMTVSSAPTEYYSYIIKSDEELSIAKGEWVKIKGFYYADKTYSGTMKKFAFEYTIRGTIRPLEELEEELFESYPKRAR